MRMQVGGWYKIEGRPYQVEAITVMDDETFATRSGEAHRLDSFENVTYAIKEIGDFHEGDIIRISGCSIALRAASNNSFRVLYPYFKMEKIRDGCPRPKAVVQTAQESTENSWEGDQGGESVWSPRLGEGDY